MIPDYKQSCTKINLDWENQNLKVFPTVLCPFCANFYGTDFDMSYIKCHKCRYIITGFSYRNGINILTYNNRHLYYAFSSGVFRCEQHPNYRYKEWSHPSPTIIDLQTTLNKMNSFIFSPYDP